MSGFISKLSIGSILFSTLALYGCGGGGGDDSGANTSGSVSYAGLSSPSAVNATNAEALTTAGGESVQHGADSASSNIFGGIQISGSSFDIETLSANLASAMAPLESPALPTAVSINGSCGGSVSIPDDQIEAYSATSGPVSFSMTFTNYCDGSVGAQYLMNGQVDFSYNDRADSAAGFTIDYNGFTVNDGSGPITINMTVVCSDSRTCSIVSDYVGGDGGVYRVADFSFNGDATSGFSGSATFYHPSHGSVYITASNVTYGSCGGYPDGGSVTANGITGTAQIVFSGDCSYAITYDDGAGDSNVINGSFI